MKIAITKKKNQTILIVIATILLLATCIFFIYVNYIQKDTTKNNTNSTTQNSSGSTSSSKDNTDTPAVINASVTPNIPTGTFVSNHRPNISGSPSPNTESSTCTTTPGATCEISFTSGNTTKSLGAKTTDSNGNISWDWSLDGIGLTDGEWTITAIAKNGDKTATSTDTMSLIVSQ